MMPDPSDRIRRGRALADWCARFWAGCKKSGSRGVGEIMTTSARRQVNNVVLLGVAVLLAACTGTAVKAPRTTAAATSHVVPWVDEPASQHGRRDVAPSCETGGPAGVGNLP
jgi:hypothetical protein